MCQSIYIDGGFTYYLQTYIYIQGMTQRRGKNKPEGHETGSTELYLYLVVSSLSCLHVMDTLQEEPCFL